MRCAAMRCAAVDQGRMRLVTKPGGMAVVTMARKSFPQNKTTGIFLEKRECECAMVGRNSHQSSSRRQKVGRRRMRGLWLAGGAFYLFIFRKGIFCYFWFPLKPSLALLRPLLANCSLVWLGLASGGGFASEDGKKIRDGGEGGGEALFCEEKRVHVSEISPVGGAVVFMSDDGRQRDGRDVRLGGLCRSRGCRSKGAVAGGWGRRRRSLAGAGLMRHPGFAVLC